MPLAKRLATSWISTLASSTFTAIYYDGWTSNRWPVEVTIDGNVLRLSGSGISRLEQLDHVEIEPQVGSLRGQIRFADGAMCEVEDGKAFMGAIPHQHQSQMLNFIHQIENKLHYIAITLVLAIAIIWGLIEFGVPIMAKSIAHAVPTTVETSMGEQALAGMDKLVFAPSELPRQRITELQRKFAEFIHRNGGNYHYKILFRNSETIGANAFALPSGIIVFTDAMVKLAKDDRELLAVLAHEMGHVERQHTLRHVLQNSISVVVLVMVTGDIQSATSLVTALPTMLVQAKYSRQFEAEADAYAAKILQQQDLSPRWLGTILARLDEEHGKDSSSAMNYLASHPPTPERIKQLKALQTRPN